jgi:hypothetical protein
MIKFSWLLLLIPISCAVLARLDIVRPCMELGFTLSCSLLLLFFSGTKVKLDAGLLIAAFLFSVAGGWFLENRHGLSIRFVLGIALYFIAHLGYMTFCLRNGKINVWFLGIMSIGYLTFFFAALRPAISDTVLSASVFVYLIISCISLAAAFGLKLPPVSARLFFTGIACLVFSDTIIAFHEFLDAHRLAFLIAPTYYASQILVTAALIAQRYKSSE